MKLLVPDTIELELDLPDSVEAVEYEVRTPIRVEQLDAEAIVVWGNPAPMLADAAARLPNLRWVQSLAAGAEPLLRAGFAPEVVLTSGQTLHDRPVAEHALALVLAAVRRLPLAVRAQLEHRWAAELGGLQPERDPDVLTTLRGARVLIWGYGGIARTVTPLLQALGATVTGVARSARTDDGVRVIGMDALDGELPGTDLLLMILPSTPATDRALDARRLALLPRRAWVVNVGRGSTVDEAALDDALRSGRLGGAALDVTAVEPLPASSPLWSAPNAIITPHAAGGRPLGAGALIGDNLRRLLAGEELRNVVARTL